MDNQFLQKNTYHFDLPEALIAQTPLAVRDRSRLLVFDRKTKQIQHRIFRDISDYFSKGDVLVLNTSKVLPARLFALKEGTGAAIEILLHKRKNLTDWEILAKPAKRLSAGTKLKFSDALSGEILEKDEEGMCVVRFYFEGVFEDLLHQIGTMPLPPYIHEKLNEKDRYQTVYAKQEGSSAAPTAGLHFTEELLRNIQNKGCTLAHITLHVGLGTFRPVKTENILEHKMHTEWFSIPPSVADDINEAKERGNNIFACGTTSVRALESAAVLENGKWIVKPKDSDTNIFIYPTDEKPVPFKIVDHLITNFHLPESTLIMLVSAFLGYSNTMKVYQTAVDENYRFFSFGDACLFL